MPRSELLPYNGESYNYSVDELIGAQVLIARHFSLVIHRHESICLSMNQFLV